MQEFSEDGTFYIEADGLKIDIGVRTDAGREIGALLTPNQAREVAKELQRLADELDASAKALRN